MMVHQDQPVEYRGRSLEDANFAVILLHGRGSTAQQILTLAHHLNRPDAAYVAPQAFANTWYPHSFLAPIEQNEPHLSSALRVIGDLIHHVEQAGISPERTLLGGFSQGACLVSEYVARNARRYGGLFVLSGGVIG